MNRLRVVKKYAWVGLLLGGLLPMAMAQQMPSKADKQYEMGMYQEAATSYQSMIDEGESTEAAVYERLAKCYMSINKPFEAIATYEAAAMRYDISTEAYMQWASALKKIGRNEEANEIVSFASIKDNVHYDDIEISDMVEYRITPVAFNSEGNEFAPAYLGDDIICVTDNYQAVQVTGVSSKLNEMPHVLMRVDATTGEKERLCGKLKDYLNDGPASYSDDQSLVCFSKGHFPAAQSPKIGNRQSGSIYVAEADDKGDWDVRISLPCNELGVANIYPSFQEDGNRIYFASNREGGFGGFDIYYMDRTGENWSAPKNMGEKINTDGDEISPSVQDGQLYFASNRLSGFGGFDLFVCPDQNDPAPVNLGHGINSSWDDYAMITRDGGDTGYFTSNRTGGKGGEDIYAFERTIKMIATQPTTATSTETTAASAKPTYNRAPTTAASAKPTTVALTSDLPTFKLAEENADPARIRTIYTIQVAALSQGNVAYKEIANKLQDVGIVYKVHFHNVIKIRVGQFDSENDARQTLEKVKLRGYQDAFVVKEELIREEVTTTTTTTTTTKATVNEVEEETTTESEVVTEEVVTEMEQPAEEESIREATTQPELKAEMTKEEYDRALDNLSRYRIRLGSYTDISAFDDSVVKRYGSVFKEKNEEWTKVYLGDYMTIEDAEAIRVEVERAGFSSAVIYGIRDGKLIKVK